MQGQYIHQIKVYVTLPFWNYGPKMVQTDRWMDNNTPYNSAYREGHKTLVLVTEWKI